MENELLLVEGSAIVFIHYLHEVKMSYHSIQTRQICLSRCLIRVSRHQAQFGMSTQFLVVPTLS